MSKYTSLEHHIRNIVQETASGTVERRKVKNVGRPEDPPPESEKSTLYKTGQIVTKIIEDEGTLEINPKLNSVPVDGVDSAKMTNKKIKLKKIVKEAMAADAATMATKAAGKSLGSKVIPGLGLAYGAADAYSRAKEGDYVGAGMAGLSGVASLVPGVGTAASMALDAANIARDYNAGKFGDQPEPKPNVQSEPKPPAASEPVKPEVTKPKPTSKVAKPLKGTKK